MPAITLGFAEFEARLDRIRRRLNAQLLVETGSIIASAAMMAAAAILLSEASLATIPAAWIRRSAVAAVILTAAGAIWRLYSRWLNLAKTARLVDRSADMEDRVATLLAHPVQDGRAPLRAILVWQVFSRSAQWEAERVAPLRFRRPATLTALAVAILVLAVLQLPEVSDDRSDATAANASAADIGSTQPSEFADAGGTDEGASSSPSGPAGQGDGGGSEAGGGSKIGLTEDGGGKAPRGTADQTAAGHETQSGDDRSRGPQDGDPEGENERDRADQAARTAGKQAPPPGSRLASDATPIERPRNSDQLRRLSSNAENQGAAHGATKRANQETPPATGDKKPPAPSGGSVAGARENKEGIGANAGGVLGERNSPASRQDSNQAESMVIQLKSFAMHHVENYEPQAKGGDASEGAGASSGTPAPIADEQWEDALFHRSAVTRAHQDLIRDLFTPDTQ